MIVVVGGGLGGMIAAAILGRAGRRVLLLEREATLGGRLRSFGADGGFVLDAGAYLWPDAYLSEALRRAGAAGFRSSEIPRQQVLRLFVEGEAGRRIAFPYPLREPSAKMLESARLVLGVDAAGYEDLSALWRRLAELSDRQVMELRHVPLRAGAARLGIGDDLVAALRRNVMVYGTYDPDSAATAECIELCRRPRDRPLAAPMVPGDNPGGGVAALVRALERALAAAGVEVVKGAMVTEIRLAGGAVTGVVAAGGIGEVAAREVIVNVPIWQAVDLFSAAGLPADFLADARAWSAVGGVIASAFAFRGMPCLRETGEPDDFPGWTRLLTRSDGGAPEFGGGMVWTTLHSPANAPPGCHVLQAMRLSPRRDVDDPARVAEVHAAFERMIDEIYLDAGDKLLWSRHWTTSDGSEYMVGAARRPPLRAPFADGLYFVGETTDVPALQMDAAALSALRCSEMIRESRGWEPGAGGRGR